MTSDEIIERLNKFVVNSHWVYPYSYPNGEYRFYMLFRFEMHCFPTPDEIGLWECYLFSIHGNIRKAIGRDKDLNIALNKLVKDILKGRMSYFYHSTMEKRINSPQLYDAQVIKDQSLVAIRIDEELKELFKDFVND